MPRSAGGGAASSVSDNNYPLSLQILFTTLLQGDMRIVRLGLSALLQQSERHSAALTTAGLKPDASTHVKSGEVKPLDASDGVIIHSKIRPAGDVDAREYRSAESEMIPGPDVVGVRAQAYRLQIESGSNERRQRAVVDQCPFIFHSQWDNPDVGAGSGLVSKPKMEAHPPRNHCLLDLADSYSKPEPVAAKAVPGLPAAWYECSVTKSDRRTLEPEAPHRETAFGRRRLWENSSAIYHNHRRRSGMFGSRS